MSKSNKLLHNGEELPDYSSWQLIKDTWGQLKNYNGRFWLATFFRLSSDLVWLYPAYALAEVVNLLTNSPTRESLSAFWSVMVLWIGASVWHYLGNHLAKYFGGQVSEGVALDSQLKTIKHLFMLDPSWHDKENAGNKIKRIQKGAEGLSKMIHIWIANIIEIGVSFVGTIVVIVQFDVLIAGLLLVFMLSYFIISFYLLKKAAAASHEVNVKEEEVLGLSFEAINNIRSVNVLDIGNVIHGLLKDNFADLFEKMKKLIMRFQIRSGILGLWGQAFKLGMLAFIAYGIIRGRYEAGFLILFYDYFGKIWESIGELADITQEFVIAKFGIARMQDILNEPISVDDNSYKVDFPDNWRKITVDNVSFAYGDKQVLKDVSFEINRGEKVGIVGLSGAGKSTLFKLLLREDESFGGDIRFDNVSIKDIKKSSYFDHVAAVLQETELFNFTLKDNITIVDSQEEENKDLSNVLDIARVSDFTHKLPNGVETKVGEKGARLSGGEKQRLGIARAIYKQPKVLLLDEATSHLDVESEKKIQESLNHVFESVTAVVIAHRLGTLREMDRILVIEDGRITESGSFADLQAKRGRFYDLWQKQNQATA